MPSPFPGMDPYLEYPGLWPDVHLNLISGTQGLLSQQLRPKYVVRVEERTYISDDSDPTLKPQLRVRDVEVAIRAGREETFFLWEEKAHILKLPNP
jgi:hypothetical protein